MKITLSNIFDANAVIKKFIDAKLQGFEDFVTAISEMNDKLTLVLRSNISIADNIDCTTKVLNMTHDSTFTIQNPDRIKQVQHITPTRVLTFANPVTSFAWAYNAKGEIEMKAQFLGSPTRPVTVTLIMYY